MTRVSLKTTSTEKIFSGNIRLPVPRGLVLRNFSVGVFFTMEQHSVAQAAGKISIHFILL